MATPTSIEDLHSDVLAGAFRRMDGPTLLSAAAATSHLRCLSTNPAIWHHLCLSTWPSLNDPRLLSLSHRAFFSDAFPFPCDTQLDLDDSTLPTQLVSAIDIYHNGTPLFSRVIETDTSSSWFLGSPFRIDGLERKDNLPIKHVDSLQELTLSWTVIDPYTQRAVNVSSREPVAIERHWYTGETLVKYGVVVRGCAVGIVVTCGEEGHVREVALTVEDMDGIMMNGRDSLGVLKAALEGGRRWKGEAAAAKRIYEEYLKNKKSRKERKMRREGILDLCCTAVGAMMFLAFLMMLGFR